MQIQLDEFFLAAGRVQTSAQRLVDPITGQLKEPRLPAAATGHLLDWSGTITVGGTSQRVMDASPLRRYLLIQNVSSGDLWFNFNAVAHTAQPSIKLAPGSSFVMEAGFVSTEAVNIVGATAGQAFVAKEG